MILVSLLGVAKSAELEVVVYDDSTATDLLAVQFQDPAGLGWPATYSTPGTGSARVYRASAPTGKLRFCVDFRASATTPWHTTCAISAVTDDLVYGVAWPNSQFAVGIYLNTSDAFSPTPYLDSADFRTVTGTCSIACDDGSACSASCNGGCSASCSPAYCSCN